MKISKLALLAASVVLCGTICEIIQADETSAYMGLDARLSKSNVKKIEGMYYKNDKYGAKPYIGFKLIEGVSVELAHEWALPLLSSRAYEGIAVSTSATSALFSVAFERKLTIIPDTKWFLAGGFAHTRIKVCESGSSHNIGYRSATRDIPTAMIGIKKHLGNGINARGFFDWKCTKGMKVGHIKDPERGHTFNHNFGVGAGLFKEF